MGIEIKKKAVEAKEKLNGIREKTNDAIATFAIEHSVMYLICCALFGASVGAVLTVILKKLGFYRWLSK